jgi:anti-anti-sigma factor
MDITVQEFKHCDMITVKGRVDSATAPQLAQALEAANDGGKYKIVVNMSELEYMSSAGFRALLAAQRNSGATIVAKLSWLRFRSAFARHLNWLVLRNSSRPLMILFKQWDISRISSVGLESLIHYYGRIPPSVL